MRLKVFGAAITALALAAAISAQDTAREQKLQQAIDLLESKGDVTRALPLLEEVAKSSDPALAARGLLYLGQAQERMGIEQARKTYERLIQQYPSQSEIVGQARSALARLSRLTGTAPALPANRILWQAPRSFFYFIGSSSPDGRLIPYMDWEGDRQDMNVYDVTTGRTRVLLQGGRQPDGRFASATSAAFSRDGAQLAYTWSASGATGGRHDQLSILTIRVPDVAKARTVLEDQSVQSIWLGAWSPDGGSIAFVLLRKGGERELSLVSVESGAIRGLKRIGSRGVSGMEFSPDGKYLVYDLGAPGVDRDIFAMQIADGSERRLVSFAGNDTFAGFAPDGRRIVFSSLRAGTPGLWTADYADGAISNLQLVKPDIAIDSTFGVTPTGALYYVADTRGMNDVKMGEFDVRRGRFTRAPVDIPADLMGVNSAPALSPDGNSVAYLTERRSDGPSFVVRPIGAGESRTFHAPLQFRNSNNHLWNWTADSSGFYAVGTSNAGVAGIHRIDATTGEISWSVEAPLRVMLPVEVGNNRLRYAEALGGRPDGVFILREWDIDARRGREVYRSNDDCRLAPDGGDTLYCVRGTSIVRREVTNGADVRVAKYEPGRAWTVSPDQRTLVTYRSGAGRADRSMWVTDLASGETRQLGTGERNFFVMWWSPDSKAVVATVGNPQESRETWWIPVDGAKPHKIEGLSGLRVAGPGAGNRQGQFAHGRFVFAISSPSSPTELSVMENFLPATPKKSGERR